MVMNRLYTAGLLSLFSMSLVTVHINAGDNGAKPFQPYTLLSPRVLLIAGVGASLFICSEHAQIIGAQVRDQSLIRILRAANKLPFSGQAHKEIQAKISHLEDVCQTRAENNPTFGMMLKGVFKEINEIVPAFRNSNWVLTGK
jgi:hypothetical protein